MNEWKKVKIGDIFAIEKGSLQSSKNTPGKYDFITAASEWKNHNSYDHDCEAIVYAVAASLGFAALENVLYLINFGTDILRNGDSINNFSTNLF